MPWTAQRRSFATNEFIAHDQAEGVAAGPLGVRSYVCLYCFIRVMDMTLTCADLDATQLLGMDIQERDHISLKWTDGRVSRYHLHHLRAWCLCSECQHETGQRLLNSSDVSPDLEIEDIFSASRPVCALERACLELPR